MRVRRPRWEAPGNYHGYRRKEPDAKSQAPTSDYFQAMQEIIATIRIGEWIDSNVIWRRCGTISAGRVNHILVHATELKLLRRHSASDRAKLRYVYARIETGEGKDSVEGRTGDDPHTSEVDKG